MFRRVLPLLKLMLTPIMAVLGVAVLVWGLSFLFAWGSSGARVAALPAVESIEPGVLVVEADIALSEKEPSLLEPLVSDGILPPLTERVPRTPLVLRGVDGIGQYGGTLLRLATGEGDVGIIGNRLSMATPMRFSPTGDPLVPHLARKLDVSDDGRSFVLHLRPGHRWSDGTPFTTADAMYWWEHEVGDPAVIGQPPDWLMHLGEPATLEALDEYRLRITFAKPNGLFPQRLASIFAYDLFGSPAHYLRQFHPTLGDETAIAGAQQRTRQPSPATTYKSLKRWDNPDHPRLWPWIYRSPSTGAPHVFVRNPFYFAVDMEGRQLPYVDRVQFDVRSGGLLALAASNGRVSMQARHLRFDTITDLMTQREAGGFQVYSWVSGAGSAWVLNPNLNRAVSKDDPASAAKAALLGEAKFRQALSLAIDRDRIVDAEYAGQAQPAQIAPPVDAGFDVDELRNASTDHDPIRAAKLLDELGFVRRDGDGWRQLDGRTLTFFIDYTSFTGPGPVQFVVDDWAKIGVRAIPRERARALFMMGRDAGSSDFMAWTGESDFRPLLSPRHFVPVGTASFWAVGWGQWYEAGGLRGEADGVGIKPPTGHPVREAMRFYDEALAESDPAARVEHFNKIAAIAAENLWTINIATAPPQPAVVDVDLRNVPRVAVDSVYLGTPGNAGLETWYFESRRDTPGAIAAARDSLINVAVASGSTPTGSADDTSWVLRGFVGIGLIGLLYAAIRYPFIGKRLLIMVPTLAVLSVVIYTIIQLPPGNFLVTQLAQLEASGDPTAQRQIEELRGLHHLDDPVWQRYCRWVGLTWFTSFDAADAGLLQGDLGRSMETGWPVNDMIGDRLLLTVAIALGTILMTWLIAIPVGVFSAVRQYTITDYVVTIVSFLGMCVPPFLLALVLMALVGASGLFSAEYAAQPEWDAAKVWDLAKHIWIPIVVLGLGGTGGMIRVMRANMLDELKKPYVTTARAKGVRPTKLVWKYPLRLAINPFVSRVGVLFPQLISGGAIVAIVLSLPTIGPMLLGALLNQDTSLAGSLLMLLSLLGIVGTLVSDLLLLALDPRIRFDGGSR
ncbi:MAG: ABC transporter substrate-binding protein [Planctomycetota bacterium]